MIHDEIRSLLDAPPSGDDAPSIDAIEHTLTAGYARALALEAERRRLERKLAEIASDLGEEANERTSEVATLGRKLADADCHIAQLRALLSSLRTRASQVRAT
jgi:predicted RNase H-like nuclease (RuvC/YqgF family)